MDELDLVKRLLNVVNSQEEFEYLKAEETRLSFLFSQSQILGNQLNKLMEI